MWGLKPAIPHLLDIRCKCYPWQTLSSIPTILKVFIFTFFISRNEKYAENVEVKYIRHNFLINQEVSKF